MEKYRRIPTIIEAKQWFKHGDVEQVERIPLHMRLAGMNAETQGFINTLEGGYVVSTGDWIIKDIKGEFSTCKPDTFKKTYELLNNKFSERTCGLEDIK